MQCVKSCPAQPAAQGKVVKFSAPVCKYTYKTYFKVLQNGVYVSNGGGFLCI